MGKKNKWATWEDDEAVQDAEYAKIFDKVHYGTNSEDLASEQKDHDFLKKKISSRKNGQSKVQELQNLIHEKHATSSGSAGEDADWHEKWKKNRGASRGY